MAKIRVIFLIFFFRRIRTQTGLLLDVPEAVAGPFQYIVFVWNTADISCVFRAAHRIQARFKIFPIIVRYANRYESRMNNNDPTGVSDMSKHEIIECIIEINKTAKPEFLDQFTVEDLDLYLEHLMEVDLEEVCLCA